ncbi:MAG: hypothetical protein AAB628_03140 [Patescibacteria group bacterium]
MLKKNWSKEIKKILTTKGVDSHKMEITPFRDWKKIATYSFVGLILSLGVNIYMSFQINDESFFSAEKITNEGAIFNSNSLSEVLEDIENREQNFEKIKKEGISVLDPSL